MNELFPPIVIKKVGLNSLRINFSEGIYLDGHLNLSSDLKSYNGHWCMSFTEKAFLSLPKNYRNHQSHLEIFNFDSMWGDLDLSTHTECVARGLGLSTLSVSVYESFVRERVDEALHLYKEYLADTRSGEKFFNRTLMFERDLELISECSFC